MVVGITATNLNGWFKGRWCFLMSLCNMRLSKSLFPDDSRRLLQLFSVLPNCLERVHQFPISLCLLYGLSLHKTRDTVHLDSSPSLRKTQLVTPESPSRAAPLLCLSRGRLQSPQRLVRKEILPKVDHGPPQQASP